MSPSSLTPLCSVLHTITGMVLLKCNYDLHTRLPKALQPLSIVCMICFCLFVHSSCTTLGSIYSAIPAIQSLWCPNTGLLHMQLLLLGVSFPSILALTLHDLHLTSVTALSRKLLYNLPSMLRALLCSVTACTPVVLTHVSF